MKKKIKAFAKKAFKALKAKYLGLPIAGRIAVTTAVVIIVLAVL
jgi:hypothetical protein